MDNINEQLSINNNSSLRALNGLLELNSIGGDLSIQNNLSLPTARAEELRDSIGEGIEGEVRIRGNRW